jgi:thiamine kinase-like enzyme
MDLSFAEIKRQFALEAERAAGRTLTSADQLPLHYEEITPAWLTSVLVPALAPALGSESLGAEVVGLRLGEADEGTSSRRRIHLTWNPAGQRAGLPASVFCKSTFHLENRYIIGMNGGIAAEATFYNSVRPKLPIVAPDALFSRYDPASLNSLIIMRDIAGEVTFGSHELTLTEEQARSQLGLLATLHARYWESPELETELAVWNSWEKYFTITVEEAGFGPSCARGFQLAEDVIPARLFPRAEEIWPATLACVAAHQRLPRTLLHSDPHLKNWFIAADGGMGLNDWQCSSKGNWGRDVAYTISTALAVENRRSWERDLLGHYLEQLRAAGVAAPDFDEAWRIYRQQLFAALAWWTGTLGQPPEAPKMQPAATAREFIRRMTHAIDDLEALDAL